jgi:hypothetical protein
MIRKKTSKGGYDKLVFEMLRKADYPIKDAMRVARLHYEAEEQGLHAYFEDDPEGWNWEGPRPNYVLWLAVYGDENWDNIHDVPKDRGDWLSSVGMVGVNTLKSPYLAEEFANLFEEALHGRTRKLPGVR